MESGCALFAALCKEDLIYSQPMNQLTLNLSFLNLNPKKLFCLDLKLGRPLALSGGQLPDEVTGVIDRRSPSDVGSVRFLGDLIRALSGEEEDKEARNRPDVIAHLGLELSQVVARRSSKPAGHGRRRWIGFSMAGLHLESPGIPAAVELDELKELYKKKKDLKYMTKQTRSYTSHRLLEFKGRHTTCSVHSVTVALLWNHVYTHTQQGYINIKSYTDTHT